MVSFPPPEEVATLADESQFDGGSLDKCGYYAVFINHFAGQPGAALPANVHQLIQQAADKAYVEYDGADIPANQRGMTLPQLYSLIVQVGNHFQALFPNMGIHDGSELNSFIEYWLGLKYSILLAVDEASVMDQALGECPYDWKPQPGQYNHLITLTGLTGFNGYFVRDSANIDASGVIRPGPRQYAIGNLQILSATVFVPAWLPRPYSAREQLAPVDYKAEALAQLKASAAALALVTDAVNHL